MNDFIVKPLSIKKIRAIAMKLHENTNIGEAFPIVRFIELILPQVEEKFELIILPKNEITLKYAETDVVNKKMYIREDVYLGAINKNGRDRFTLAHELGHLLLHSGISKYPRFDKKKDKIYCSPEWQANTFARELLVP